MLTLIRGAPGSGKSTVAKKIANAVHIEADQFFMVGDTYVYDPKRIGEAHAWCQARAIEAMAAGKNVVVSNTFTKVWELNVYLTAAKALGAAVKIIRCVGTFTNVHNVPKEIVRRMLAEYEPHPDEETVK